MDIHIHIKNVDLDNIIVQREVEVNEIYIDRNLGEKNLIEVVVEDKVLNVNDDVYFIQKNVILVCHYKID